jgi:hypothetical protein
MRASEEAIFVDRMKFQWVAFNNLKMRPYESSIADLESKTLNVLAELKSQNLIIEQIVTLKVLNIQKWSFSIYLIVLMKSVRKKNKFSSLINLFQNLAHEENRQRAESVINLRKMKLRSIEINRETTNERIRRLRTKRTTRITTKRINALNEIVSIIQKTNARQSILNASNVIKLITEDRCVESKRWMISSISNHLVETTKPEMNSSLKRSH